MPTLLDRFRDKAAEDPGSPALFGPVGGAWRQLSRGAWWASVLQTAGGLLGMGLRPGDRVVLWAEASPEWVVSWLAVMLAGGEALILDPAADDAALVVATVGEDARYAVVGGRDRLERILLLREHGGAALDRVITLERMNLRTPRLIDLETLIEQGASADADFRALASGSATRFVDGARWSSEALGACPPIRRLALSATPTGPTALSLLAGAVAGGGELWVSADAGPLVAELPYLDADAVCFDAAGWAAALEALDRAEPKKEGVRGGLLRLSRGAAGAGGPVGAMARGALERLEPALGLRAPRRVAVGPVERTLKQALRRHRVPVEDDHG